MPPGSGPPNPRIHRWLQSRIDAVLDDDGVPVRAQTIRPASPGVQRGGRQTEIDEEEEDLATELADPWDAHGRLRDLVAAGDLEGSPDPDTVQLNHIPVSFINEAVMDEVTVEDLRADAVRWRAEGYTKGIAVTPLMPEPRVTQQQQGSPPDRAPGRLTPGPPPPPPGLRTVPLSRMVPPPPQQREVPPELRASVTWTSQEPSLSTLQHQQPEAVPLPEARALGALIGFALVVGLGLLALGLVWLL